MEKTTVVIIVMKLVAVTVWWFTSSVFFENQLYLTNFIPIFNFQKNEIADTCPLNYFRCRNRRCVPTSRICNGNDDCGDGTDETDGCLSEYKMRCM